MVLLPPSLPLSQPYHRATLQEKQGSQSAGVCQSRFLQSQIPVNHPKLKNQVHLHPPNAHPPQPPSIMKQGPLWSLRPHTLYQKSRLYPSLCRAKFQRQHHARSLLQPQHFSVKPGIFWCHLHPVPPPPDLLNPITRSDRASSDPSSASCPKGESCLA